MFSVFLVTMFFFSFITTCSLASLQETLIGVVGADFVMLGADSSVSQSIALQHSQVDKIHILRGDAPPFVAAAAAGDLADVDRLMDSLKAHAVIREYESSMGSDVEYSCLGNTHSHSLFIALQDTSAAMGATSFCPGTHYCANDGMSQVCQEYGFAISEASPHKVWHSGDAALLSQHVWHRGAKHVDPEAPERILFVMTFLARPNLTKDRRQLSRGTYFHMRWNMWVSRMDDCCVCVL